MFRRKEEAMNDPSNPASSTSASPGGNSQTEPVAQNSGPQTSMNIGSQGTGGTAYVPGAPAARSSVEPPRSAAAPSSYRPTPIAEFNRGASRSPSDAMRAPAPSSGSTFGAPDKSPGGTKGKGRILTVGNDILLKGEIATCDRLVIEGRVEAKLSDVHTVEIAECGSFKGTAEVEDAEISGVFEGDLIVRNRLVIYASGEVRGNISYGEIEIERGGRLTGQIKTAAGAAAAKGATKPFENQEKRSKETAAA